jgi:CoA:oxalate CoA-transferase
MVVSAEAPKLGPIKMQGNPIKLSAYNDPLSRAPAPDLDANRDAILS